MHRSDTCSYGLVSSPCHGCETPCELRQNSAGARSEMLCAISGSIMLEPSPQWTNNTGCRVDRCSWIYCTLPEFCGWKLPHHVAGASLESSSIAEGALLWGMTRWLIVPLLPWANESLPFHWLISGLDSWVTIWGQYWRCSETIHPLRNQAQETLSCGGQKRRGHIDCCLSVSVVLRNSW